MNDLPINISWEEDDIEKPPVGTYWTPPLPVGIHELLPALRAAMLLAVEARFEKMDQFEIYLAHAFDMETCAPAGTFVVSTDKTAGRALGIYNDVGVKEAMWFACEGDTDDAFKSLYNRVKESGYLP